MESTLDHCLFFGDNLEILREQIKAESVDLVYLDPPFNSHANYNVLFKTPKGHESAAQIEAFEDTWHWNEQAEREFGELVHQPNSAVAEMMQALRRFLGENDMMAYLTLMANRLLELHRVLKPTGSLYLHCDPTASHYLKMVLDGVFGQGNFRNEIIWKRQSSHNDAVKKYGAITDTILFYAKTEAGLFNVIRSPLNLDYVAKFYRHDDKDGRGLYQLDNMASPQPRPNMMYEWLGYAYPVKGWRYEKATMQRLHDEGRIHYPEDKTNRPRLKRFLHENEGQAVANLWDDIQSLTHGAAESLGYPTQKPVALLERIIKASSNEGDTVLDPFCGGGTAVHAAQKLKRKWIGIDITHLAITLIEKRLRDAYPGIEFTVHGTPKDEAGARNLAERDKYQFQWWACSLVNAQPFQGKKKGADGGIDGLIYFPEDGKTHAKIIVSVKGGEHVSVAMVRDLAHGVAREKAAIGLFVTLTAPTQAMETEAIKTGYYAHPLTGRSFPKIQLLTIAALLDGTAKANYPDASQGGTTFKKAKVEEKINDQKILF